MTNGNPGPDETPAPPTSTGSFTEDDGHDDELAPPFVPGRAEPEAADAGPLAAPFDPAAAGEEADEAATGEAFPFDTGWDDAERAEAPEEDAFPVEAFDIEGDEAGWGAEPGPAPDETLQMEAAREVAGRLEEMARRLRDQGPQAARAELDSPDRFTALLAGLLAGYLAGKDRG